MGISEKMGRGMGGIVIEIREHGNGREWECKKPFPVISSLVRYTTAADRQT